MLEFGRFRVLLRLRPQLVAKTAILSGPSSAGATGSLAQFGRPPSRVRVSARREGARQIEGLFAQWIVGWLWLGSRPKSIKAWTFVGGCCPEQ